jgi:molybdopterin molybdotransferase/putative molybdopterin biosynthesis protein
MLESGSTRAQVLDALFDRWAPAQTSETVALATAYDRVLARDYVALYDQPVVRASSMDGIGVNSALFVEGMPDTSAWQEGREYVRADTGDDFPDEYDAIIPIERVSFCEGGGIVLDLERGTDRNPGGAGNPSDDKPIVYPGLNIRPAGNSVAKGELLVAAGTKLRPLDLAVLAAGGITEIQVRKRPVVAFIPTGSELVSAGTVPTRGKTIDSNTVLVAGMLREMGAETVCLPIVRDDPAALEATLTDALATADMVLINAGSSKGGEDYNARLLEEMGEVLCHWIAAAPGRPLCAAIVQDKPVINIPGPPLATYYVMDWCTRALVARALGISPAKKRTATVTLTADLKAPSHMEILHRLDVRSVATDADGANDTGTDNRSDRLNDLDSADTGLLATPIPMRQSTLPRSFAANAQFVNQLGRKDDYHRGETIEVELLSDLRISQGGYNWSYANLSGTG